MGNDTTNFDKSRYNIFSICEDFRQRLAELQRLKSLIKPSKQDLEKSDVSNQDK